MKDFIKQNMGSVINWSLTLGWMAIVFYLWQYSGIKKPDELNEVGDFLAGVFAPLAFFWLVRGFYQQGKGLEQNSIALNLQAQELQASTEALNLQVQEMKASVEQQKQMAEYQRLEIEERHNTVEPFIEVDAGFINSGGLYSFTFYIKNISDNDARNILVEIDVTNCSVDASKHFNVLTKGTNVTITSAFTANEKLTYESHVTFERVIHLKYESILGRAYEQIYLLEVGKSLGSIHKRITRTS